MRYTQKVVIIGGGISGLACAYRLRQLGVPCLVLEAEAHPGGVIATARRDGYLFEMGPQCPRFPTLVWQLVQELRLKDEFVAGDPAVKRYLYRYGALHPAPFSPGSLLGSKLVSLSSKWRVLTEALRTTQPPPGEETLAEFVTRKFGADLVDNLADPIISTIFFADAYKMGMQSAFPALVEWERNHGSLVRGAIRARNTRRNKVASDGTSASVNGTRNPKSMKVTDSLPSLGSFRSGMARLPERLAEELGGDIRYGVRVESVAPIGVGWQLALEDGERITTDQIVLAVPAYEAARMLDRSRPDLARELQGIEYAPMGGVASGYDRSQVKNSLEGFGFMIPRKEGFKTICTFWNSSLFPERAPLGKVLITSFVRCETAETDAIDDATFARGIEAENTSILGIAGAPAARQVWRQRRALPQYNVGHSKRVEAIQQILPTVSHLHLAGNYLQGRSIGDCVELAFQVAEKAHSQVAEVNIQPVSRSSEG